MDSKVKKYCPNCSQLYIVQSLTKTQNCNLPLFLACGHSMCEKCITNIIKFKEPIECKVCHKDTEIDPSLILLAPLNLRDYFPVNTFMIGELFLDLIESPGIATKNDEDYYINLEMILKDGNQENSYCMECNSPTTKKCKQCDFILCESCFNKSHNNFIMFKSHVLGDIEKAIVNNCKIHQKPLAYYCNDCLKVLCMDCLMVGNEKSCKSHNMVTMKEANATLLEDLNNVTPKVDEIFKRLTKSAVDIGNLLQHINNENESATELTQIMAKVEHSFSKLCYEIQKHKKEVMDSIIKLKNSEKKSLQKAKEDIADSLKKVNNVMKMIEITSDYNKLEELNLTQLLEMAKETIETPWFLKKDDKSEENLKLTINEDLCTLISDYLHLEGNANYTYKLNSTSELGSDVELPPVPKSIVYPPELPKDVRLKVKPKVVQDVLKGQSFHKSAPKYRSKSISMASLNSSDSGDSNYRSFAYDNKHQKPAVHRVLPFPDSQYTKRLEEGTQELIYISHIVDPHDFYVQRACHQSIVKEMMVEFRNAISYPKPSLNHIAEGKFYLVYQKADNMWHRCKIVNISRSDMNKTILRVLCIDFGNFEVVTIDNLRLLPPARVQSPEPLAIHCFLANCVPKTGSWTKDDAFLIQNIIDNKQAVMHVRNIRSAPKDCTMQIECDITTLEYGVSIAHALVFHERAKMPNPRLPYVTPKSTREKPKIFTNNDSFKTKSVEEVYITHIVNPDKFFVRKAHHQKIYDKLLEDMEKEYSLQNNSGIIYLPQVDMVCVANVAKYRVKGESHTWERGIVCEMLGRSRIRIFLPDTGEILQLHYSSLRYIHHNFTILNALATECHLAGVTPLKKKWSAGAVALLQKFEDQLLELHVEENRNRSTLSVTLYDKSDPEDTICINNEMVKYKYAVTFGLFNFNKNDDTADQVMIDKYPFDEAEVHPKQKEKKSVILKKQTPKKIKDLDLEAKDKGPLRLEAKVLNYQSPSLIYVSLVHQQKTFNELFDNLQKYYKKTKAESDKTWLVNDRCCALCIQSKTWRRAVILDLTKDTAKVFYSDFASIETVPLCDLRDLTAEFASIGDAAIKCHLCGVIPAVGEEWPSLTKEFLKELLDAYRRIFITKLGNFKNKSMPIEIWVYHTIQGGALEPNKSEWRCLNKKIIEQGLGIPDKSHEVTNIDTTRDADNEMVSFLNVTGSIHDWLQLDPIPIEPSEIKPDVDTNSSQPNIDDCESSDNYEKTDENSDSSNVVYISDWLPAEPLPNKEFTAMPTYVDNEGVIYLHDISQQDTLNIIRKALDVRFKETNPKTKYINWTIGEPCIALFFLDNRYYRGRIVEVNKESSSCLIHYIDYGNEEMCSFSNLRKDIVLHQIPIQATKCILDRIQPIQKQWSRQTLDYIHQTIVEKECYVKVAGEPIGDKIPIELKYNKLWLNDHLIEFEMATYCNGTKPTVTKYTSKDDNEIAIIVESDSGPDFIVEEDPESTSFLSTSHDSLDIKAMEGKDWNEMLDDDSDSLEISYMTYPKHNKSEFKCNICLINDSKIIPLNILDDNIEKEYQEIFETIQKDSATMQPLNGIFENKACIALYTEDGLWYRAAILQYSESKGKVKVRYVDFGNIAIISVNDVKETKEEWIHLPPLSIAAMLYDVNINSNADMEAVAQAYAKVLLDKGPFDVAIINYVETTPIVELRNENGELINEILNSTDLFSPSMP